MVTSDCARGIQFNTNCTFRDFGKQVIEQFKSSSRYVGSSSSLERIGVSCFEESGAEEVSIPDGVREFIASEGARDFVTHHRLLRRTDLRVLSARRLALGNKK